MTAVRKTAFIKSYGCQMNVYDSERMAAVLEADGYASVDDPADADLVVLNTCHIREKAAEKVYSELGRLRQLGAARVAAGRGRTMVAVAGCVAQAEGAEMVARAPVIDIVVGPQAYHRLPELIGEARVGRPAIDTTLGAGKFSALGALPARAATAAFLTVQEGCDKFCTFCVVPYTRGAEYSRPVDAILGEARRLAAAGVRELTLLGQNVNAYAGEAAGGTFSLARLLHALAEVPGIARLRYTTSHPRDMGDDLIAAHRELPQLMPYLHLPFQAGSDAILKAMNRGHTIAQYRRTVDRLRAARPDIALSTDVIVGFPGETDADFDATLDVARDVGFASSYSFKYSARPGTPAAEMAGQVPEACKAERLAVLQQLLYAQQTAFNAAQVGRVLPVLVERAGRQAGQMAGRSPYLQTVNVGGAPSVGTIVDVAVTAAGPNSLVGVPA